MSREGGGIRIVINDQYTNVFQLWNAFAFQATALVCSDRFNAAFSPGGRADHRQPDGKGRALVLTVAFGRRLAAVQFRQTADNRQSQSQTAVFASFRSILLPERVEDVRQKFRF